MQATSNSRLTNQIVLVTGGTDGIGAACAREFLRRGASVVVAGLNHGLDGPEGALTLHGDLTDREFRKRLVATIKAKFGRLDVLVNNAGVGMYSPLAHSQDDEISRIFELNVFAPVSLARDLLQMLRSGGRGVVVNTASVAAWANLPWSPVYCASKSALQSFSEGMYREFREFGIHVVTVAPGIVDTGFRDHVIKGEVPEGVRAIRGAVNPEALANAIVNAVEKRRRWVVKPWTVIPFALANALTPALIDWYCRSRWRLDTAAVPKKIATTKSAESS